MKKRVLVPEILDNLPESDPAAIRGRKDLRMINGLMGNFPWISRSLEKIKSKFGENIQLIELGAGDGALAEFLIEQHPNLRITAVDLVERPDGLSENIEWEKGDVFEVLPRLSGDVLVANLILHHLTDRELGELGKMLRNFRAVITNEPARRRINHVSAFGARLLGINYVTRHDIHASINAGFVGDELASLLGLEDWECEIGHSAMGSHRMLAVRENSG